MRTDIEKLRLEHNQKLDSLSKEHSNTLSKLKEQHNDELKQKVEECESIRATGEKKLEKALAQHGEAIKMLSAGSNSEKKLQEEITNLQLQLTNTTTTRDKEQLEKEAAISKLDGAARRVADMEVTVKELQSQKARDSEVSKLLQQQVKEMLNNIAQLKQAKENAEESNKVLIAEKQKLAASSGSAQEKEKQLVQLKEIKDKEHVEKERALSKLEAMEKHGSELENTITSLRTEIDHIRTANDNKIDSISKQHAEVLQKAKEQYDRALKEKATECENIRNAAEKKLEATISQHGDNIEKLKEQLLSAGSTSEKKYQQDIANLQTQLATVTATRDKEQLEKEKYLAKLEENEKHVAELDKTVTSLRAEIENIRSAYDKKLESQALQHTEGVNKLKEQHITELDKKALECESIRAAGEKKLEETMAKLKEQLSASGTSEKKSQGELMTLQLQLASATSAKEKEELDKKHALTKLDSSEKRVLELDETVKSLRTEMETCRTTYDKKNEALKFEHSEAIQTLKSEHASALKEKSSECDSLRKTVKKLEEALEKQKEQLTNAGNVEKKLQEDLSALQLQLVNASTAKEKEHLEKERAFVKLEESEKRNVELNNTVSALRIDIENTRATLQNKIDLLQIQYADSTQKLKDQCDAEKKEKAAECENIRITAEKKLQETMSQHNEAISELKNQLLSAGSSSEKKCQEMLMSMQLQLANVNSAKEKEHLEKERAFAKLEASDKRISELDTTVSSLRADIENMRTAHEKKIESLLAQQSEVLQKLKEQHTEELTKKAHELKEQLSASGNTQEELIALQLQLSNITSAKEKEELIKNQLADKLEENNKLVSELKGKVTSLTEEIENSRTTNEKQVESLHETIQRLKEQHDAEVKEKEAECEHTRISIEKKLQETTMQHVESIEKLKEQLSAGNNSDKKYQEEIIDLQEKLTNVSATFEKALSEQQRTAALLEEEQKRIGDMDDELQEARKRIPLLEEELTQLHKSQEKSMDNINAEQEKSLIALNEQHLHEFSTKQAEWERMRVDMETKLEAVTLEHNTTLEKLKEQEEKCADLIQTLTDLEQQKLNAEPCAKEVEKDFNVVTLRLSQQERLLEEKEAEVAVCQEKNQEYEHRIEELEDQVGKLSKKVSEQELQVFLRDNSFLILQGTSS